MKILDIPQSGKRGLNVSMNGRYGQVSRTLVIPANPQTPAQLAVRDIFARVNAAWRGLTDAQRATWHASSKGYQSKSRLGQSGPLTGSQLHAKVNAINLTFGEDQLTDAPPPPEFGALAPANLTITNTDGNIAVRLTCPTDPGANTIIRATPPLSAGRSVPGSMTILGLCPAPNQGSANITNMYVARYGVPPVGKRIFVKANIFSNGIESIGQVFDAVVPQAT